MPQNRSSPGTLFMMKKAKLIGKDKAARLMEVSPSRLNRLLLAGRVKGAQRVDGKWVIPVPVTIIPGKRGPISRHEASGGRTTNGAMGIHFSSRTGEWRTPKHIIERVVHFLGGIDLDPCSDSKAHPNVPATRHFIEEDDGLRHYWYGRVYMNPPYGDDIAGWVEHLRNEFLQGRTTEAIALVPARTDTRWFRKLASFPKCFVHGRLKFGNASNSAPFPSVVIYLGPESERFVRAFAEIGTVYGPAATN